MDEKSDHDVDRGREMLTTMQSIGYYNLKRKRSAPDHIIELFRRVRIRRLPLYRPQATKFGNLITPVSKGRLYGTCVSEESSWFDEGAGMCCGYEAQVIDQ